MIERVIGIVGAGTMGRQLALLCASRGLSVVIWNHVARSDFAHEFMRLCTMHAKLGLIQKDSIAIIQAHVTYTDKLEELSRCSFIIESVKEDNEIKTAVIRRLATVVSENAIIATNSSTLSTTGLAGASGNPENFIGMHFFNPPMSMRLVEVVKGELTAEETVQAALGFLSALDKHAVVMPEAPGFIVNRLLFPLINEAIFLLSEGVADAKTIDSCMKMGANHPMGPLELADFIGLDVCLSILETLVHETGDAKYRPAYLLKKYVRAGKLGKKTGVGFYSYRRKLPHSPGEDKG